MMATAVAVHALLATPGQAIETYDIRDSNGVPFMRVRIFGTGDGPYCCGETRKPEDSLRNLSRGEIDQSLAAIRHWAEIIKVVHGQSPASVNIGGFLDNNAHASIHTSSDIQGAGTKVQAALTGQDPSKPNYGAHGMITIGEMGFSSEAYIPSQLSMTPQANLTAVVFHEGAHQLGIGSSIFGYFAHSPYFPEAINAWTTHLYDDNGKQAKPGQAIYCSGCANSPADEVFDLRHDQGYFAGKHVNEVLAGGHARHSGASDEGEWSAGYTVRVAYRA